MTTRAVAEMDDWNTVPFDGGYAGLRDLADGGFSGIVQSGAAKLCLLNGTAVGVLDGSIEDFEDASGTAYEAPSPALPLLALMQERGDEVKAKYYSEDTPISEVDRTLSDGGFSGYIELSENVLSGDYYVVYHAGRSMSVAWVGNTGELLTEDEAFQRADDEVGIYEVRQVDVEPVEIPGASGGSDAGRAAGTSAGVGAASGGDSATGATDQTSVTADATASGGATGGESTSSTAASGGTGSGANDRSGAESGADEPATRDESSDTAVTTGETAESTSPVRDETGHSPADEARETEAATGAGTAAPTRRLETRSIPSLDPNRTTDGSEDDGGRAVAADSRGASPGASSTDAGPDAGSAPDSGSSGGPESASRSGRETPDDGGSAAESPSDASGPGSSDTPVRSANDAPSRSVEGPAGRATDTAEGGSAASSERIEPLEAEIEEKEAEIERLESALASVRTERDDHRAEVTELEAEVERLRSELADFEERFGGAVDADQRLDPAQALDGTNLFVRYGSKGKATLESAHGGNATREEVAENLDLEYHTQFDAANVSVGGQSFEAFLRDTLQYRFVHWIVHDLLYEIRDTGTVAALQDLYDAIPDIDRAELDGAVTVEYTEDGQQKRSEESFDVVLRDRMGTPLVVANLNDSREAASESMMRSLVTASSRVVESTPSMAAAVLVTSSFFDPEALETAADATSGSLLSRDKRESFVKLSRKRGYHLCLAEARENQFHLAVPEL